MSERITVEEASPILGLPARTIQQMAARGIIPGAAKFGRRWTFDERKLRAFIRGREEETQRTANASSARVLTRALTSAEVLRMRDNAIGRVRTIHEILGRSRKKKKMDRGQT